jgi:hypothetical protein
LSKRAIRERTEAACHRSVDQQAEAVDTDSHPGSAETEIHSTRIDPYFRRPDQIVSREFYSEHKLCYITHRQSPFLKSKGGGVLMATKKAAKKPAKKAVKKKK